MLLCKQCLNAPNPTTDSWARIGYPAYAKQSATVTENLFPESGTVEAKNLLGGMRAMGHMLHPRFHLLPFGSAGEGFRDRSTTYVFVQNLEHVYLLLTGFSSCRLLFLEKQAFLVLQHLQS